ncbi:uncharacterized protein LOC113794637 [Dermatophagoides pteronyssinus]|uniref:SH2 domain-containing protein n=1 Tax=Dermatophagoides pteronyssinus TaxID=6956 RepID=A0A6P6Y6D4_DERPT|nr:putative uncharacterized protein DDB_G0282129 isoform X2 [Dermatophagoides pteronyssinus]
MGQTRSKLSSPTIKTSTLSTNSWRRLSDSDCLHLLSHPEYFDNQINSIEEQYQQQQQQQKHQKHEQQQQQSNNGRQILQRSGSTSIFFDTIDDYQSIQPFQSSLLPVKTTMTKTQQQQNFTKNNSKKSDIIHGGQSLSSSYRNSMYPGSSFDNQHFCSEHDNNNRSMNGQNGDGKPSQLPPASGMNTGQLTARIRPLSMFGGQTTTTTLESLNDNKSTTSFLLTGSSSTSLLPELTESTTKQLENLNLSLDDILEQVNQTESTQSFHHHHHHCWSIINDGDNDGDTDSGQTLIAKHFDDSDNMVVDGGHHLNHHHQTTSLIDLNQSNISNDDNPDIKLPSAANISPPPLPPPLPPQSINRQISNGGVGIDNGRRIISTTTNPIRCSGLDCMCERCLQNRFKLLNWLLPNCTRMNSERLLSGKSDGTFLVRKSEKFPGQYTLSFVCRRKVRHCLIMRSVYGFGLRWPYSFETLQQVIIHYSQHSLTEFNSKLNIRLRYPVFSA